MHPQHASQQPSAVPGERSSPGPGRVTAFERVASKRVCSRRWREASHAAEIGFGVILVVCLCEFVNGLLACFRLGGMGDKLEKT